MNTRQWTTSAVAAVAAVIVPASTARAEGGLMEGIEFVVGELAQGGNVMWFLLALSIAALAFTLERLIRLRRHRIMPRGFAEDARMLWKQGRHQELTQLCKRRDSILARVVRVVQDYRNGRFEDVKAAAEDVATSELRIHFRRTQPLMVVGTLAPLVGLLGTVIGMIGAFRNFRLLGETGDPSIFAGDISKAMITTATGLVIAVPTLALYHFFRGRANSFGDALETQIRVLTMEWFIHDNGNAGSSSNSASAATAGGDDE